MRRAAPLFALAAIVSWAVLPPRASAYDLQPIVIQLASSGPGSSGTVVITNSHDEPIAIEARAYRRSQRPDGTDDLTPEDEDIIITPPQMVIAPAPARRSGCAGSATAPSSANSLAVSSPNSSRLSWGHGNPAKR
jgi:P pilus assembly chaperone PapD